MDVPCVHKGVDLTLWWIKMLEENWEHLATLTEEYLYKRRVFLLLVPPLYQVIYVNGRFSWPR